MWSSAKTIPKTICKQKGILVRVLDTTDRIPEFSTNIPDMKKHYSKYQQLLQYAYVQNLFKQKR
jgi:hypothetical protein